MKKISSWLRKQGDEHKTKQELGAQRTMLEELFNDMYLARGKVYRMNFVRGLLFGLGSALGGTVVLALLVWVASLFVDFPLVGDQIQSTLDALQSQNQ